MFLIGNALKQLAKSVLTPLILIAAASATDVAIHKKMFGLGVTTMILSKEKMNNIIKIPMLNYATSQNKPKKAKTSPNKPKQAKANQSELKQPKTRQNDPK